MRTHLKIVAIGNIVVGALAVLGGVLLALGLSVFGIATGEVMSGLLLGTVGVIAGVFLALFGIPQLVAGFGLLAGKNWARYVLIVTSALSLFGFPVGTILGGYSLWVLTNSETKLLTPG